MFVRPTYFFRPWLALYIYGKIGHGAQLYPTEGPMVLSLVSVGLFGNRKVVSLFSPMKRGLQKNKTFIYILLLTGIIQSTVNFYVNIN
jgi:hypothetical protein